MSGSSILSSKKATITAKEARKLAGGIYNELSDVQIEERIKSLEVFASVLLDVETDEDSTTFT